uniref:Disease resistance protein At1g59780 n=1 Tax=Nicotiana tabacum TaxID=4097 RepID=A0A1S3YZX3_TOBAC|nr:PREDICTED: putative disease resistance protein At1g59780 [Nicotiana tabacum]
MHDMIRELCLKEARNTNFVEVISTNNDLNLCGQSMHFPFGSRGRISIQLVRDNEVRSMFQFSTYRTCNVIPEMVNIKLLRVLALDNVELADPSLPSFILELIHLRYLSLGVSIDFSFMNSIILVPLSIASLHYLQTLHLKNMRSCYRPHRFRLPMEIFDMLHLRYLCLDWNYMTHFNSSDKSCDLKTLNWNYASNFVSGERSLVLKNLQHLSGWNPL